MKVIPETCCAH